VSGPALVTGATGFAGSHLVDDLVEGGAAVAAWRNPAGAPAQGDRGGRVSWRAVDLFDRDAVTRALAETQPSSIYHLAGIAHVGDSWAAPLPALRVNVLATHSLLDSVARSGLTCPVLVAGSAMVYRQSMAALREDDPIGPSSPYAVSKLGQEMLARRAALPRVLVARPFNHAGPRQAASYVTSSFARQIAEIEDGRREPVLHVGNLDAKRDITDVRDTVRGYRLLVAHGRPARPYNICSGQAHRVSDLLRVLLGCSRVRIDVEVDTARLRPNDNPVILGDPSRIATEAGWRPEIPMARTLADLLDYWRARIKEETASR
jgi:GDP-4-dehydro-6-deoxy-D-mannose reductase